MSSLMSTKKYSLKVQTRRNWEASIKRWVTSDSKTPTNWKHFLWDSTNMAELFEFPADKICRADSIKSSTVVANKGPLAFTNSINKSLDSVSPFSSEDDDTRLFIYARVAALTGNKSILLKTMTLMSSSLQYLFHHLSRISVFSTCEFPLDWGWTASG